MKKSIRSKIMLSVMVMVAVAFLAAGLGASRYFYVVLEQHTVLEEEQKQDQVSKQIEYIQNNIEAIAKQIVVDSQLQKCLHEGAKKDIIDNLLEESNMKAILRRYINQQSYIYGVTILSEDGRTFSSNTTEDGASLAEEDWYLNFKDSGRWEGFSDAHMYTVEKGNTHMEAISYVMSFKDLTNGRDVLGDIIIHISCTYLREFTNLDSLLLEGYGLFDAYGNKLAESGTLSGAYDEFKDMDEGRKVLKNKNTLLIRRNMQDGWILVSEVSNVLLTAQLRFIKIFFVAVFLCVAGVLIVVLFFLIRSITKPIEQLHTAAVEVGRGNLDVAVDITTNDELAVLGKAFNSMTSDIQKRIQESIAYEKTTKEMEINRLMLQINPHFIYNTLNSIVYLARIQGNEDIVRFSNAFISLLQDTLRVKRDSIFTSMSQEIKNVKNYLLLQEYRYPNRFEVCYDIDEQVMDVAVPNVLVQPIVENAVFHGLAAKMEKGHLGIHIHRTADDRVEIVIADDGVGMSEDTVERILSDEDPIKGEMRTIGVGNVNQRIRHIYGEAYKMHIESVINKGTKVTIVIPYRKYEETGEKE